MSKTELYPWSGPSRGNWIGYARQSYPRWLRYGKKILYGAQKYGPSFRPTVDENARKIALLRRRQKLMKPETKYADSFNAVASVPNTGTIYHLTDIDQGDTEKTRTGNDITLLTLLIRFQIIAHSSSNATQFRMIIVQSQKSGTPTVTEILNSVDPLSAKQRDSPFRTRTLYDKLYSLDDAWHNSPVGKIFIKIRKKRCSYLDNAGSNPQAGNLFLLVLADEATNTPTMEWIGRVTFYDA